MHRLQKWHDRFHQRRRQRFDDAPRDRRRRLRNRRLQGYEMPVRVPPRLIEGRHVDPGENQEIAQPLCSRSARVLPLAHHVRQLQDGVLALAEEERVDERRHRLRVERAAPTRDHDRMLFAPLSRPHRYPTQVERVQHVRVRHFVLQREADDIKRTQRPTILQAPQRDRFPPQLRLHVLPRREHALTGHVVHAVQDVVQDAQPHVRHADVIRVGVGQRDAHVRARPVLRHAVPLPARVPGRLRNARQ